ncbi:hypothetical protein [Actinomadura logoneensis]|uniref:hypothetical protein n=1 Tax=Actinomadura logoneensis TaxID=2293572 RepID=UPI0011C0CD54|nr:hypothetical protein [Actinomadura logoneensis]
MRKAGKSALTSVSLAATAVVAVTAAGVAGTWTVLPGGPATAVNSGNMSAKDLATGLGMTCTKAVASATAKSGSGLSPNDLVTINSVKFSNPANVGGACSGPVGITVSLTAQNLPWKLSGTQVTSTGADGKITGVAVSTTSSDNCHATYGAPGGGPGEVDVSYINSVHAVKVTGTNLVVQTADANCDPTLINAGDALGITGTFVITPAETITSP